MSRKLRSRRRAFSPALETLEWRRLLSATNWNLSAGEEALGACCGVADSANAAITSAPQESDDDGLVGAPCPTCGASWCVAHLDASGNIYYAYPEIPVEVAAGLPSFALPPAATFPLEDTFRLHSRPSASKTIYLDFTGHVTQGTGWRDSRNGSDRIVTPAYDTDGIPADFNRDERLNIQEIWHLVAEDFSPFDVNVTTAEPPLADLINEGAGDERWGIRVVIGGDNRWLGASAGGVAFLNTFAAGADVPTFVFSRNLGGGVPKLVAEAASHEVGHTLGLTHDGELPDTNFDTYYNGHGSGATGWAPIMGVGYGKQLVQWSHGEYLHANNPQDDLAVITGGNGFGFRPDDFGNTIEDAAIVDPALGELVAGTELITVSIPGVVERRTDIDVFEFSTLGPVAGVFSPALVSPNLDILVTLWDAAGDVVRQVNPADALDASFDMMLEAGTYFISIEGTGKVDPLGGYTDYASLGQYTIDLTYQPSDEGLVLPAVSIEPPVINVQEGNAGVVEAEFVAKLSKPSARRVRVTYATLDATATVFDNDYRAAAGVLEFAPGETEKRGVIEVVGDTVGEEDESFLVVLSSPVNATLAENAAMAEIVIVDDDPSMLTIGDVVSFEVDGANALVDVMVRLSKPAAEEVTVDYATIDGTATAGEDYLATAGRLVFAPGEREKVIPVTLVHDTESELREAFSIVLTNPSNNIVLGNDTAIITIIDDDLPAVVVQGGVGSESSRATGLYATFRVSLTAPAEDTVVLRYSTSDGTATAGIDYVATTGAVMFRPGRTESLVRVRLLNDFALEADETFFLEFEQSGDVTVDPELARGVFTIEDDESRQVTITGPEQDVFEGDDAVFTVHLSKPSIVPVAVRFTTIDGTARASRQDYRRTAGMVVFSPGETEQVIRVPVLADALIGEDDEQFRVQLRSVRAGVVVPELSTASATIIDVAPPIGLPEMTRLMAARPVGAMENPQVQAAWQALLWHELMVGWNTAATGAADDGDQG